MIRPSLPIILGFLLTTLVLHLYLLMQWRKPLVSENLLAQAVNAPKTAGSLKIDEPRPRLDEKRMLTLSTPLANTKLRTTERVKAAIVILTRNSELEGLQKTIPMMEKRFNQHYNYPYVFLNDVDFTEEFIQEIKKLSPSKMSFGKIPVEHWSYPSWIDQNKAKMCREDYAHRNIIYGGSESYRHMCRYNSGFFYRHPLLAEYDYYWRVEPTVEFYCDMVYNPFLFMKQNNKDYGFVIMLPEYRETIPTLWETTKQFMAENSAMIPPNNSLKMVKDSNNGYNLCHFWSNFEIGNLNFFRGKEYSAYFDHLDKAGGFFYERWGDAPVHSLGVAMFLPRERIHFFEDIGYYHGPFTNCPANPALQAHCECDPEKSVSKNNECLNHYYDLFRR